MSACAPRSYLKMDTIARLSASVPAAVAFPAQSRLHVTLTSPARRSTLRHPGGPVGRLPNVHERSADDRIVINDSQILYVPTGCSILAAHGEGLPRQGRPPGANGDSHGPQRSVAAQHPPPATRPRMRSPAHGEGSAPYSRGAAGHV